MYIKDGVKNLIHRSIYIKDANPVLVYRPSRGWDRNIPAISYRFRILPSRPKYGDDTKLKSEVPARLELQNTTSTGF